MFKVGDKVVYINSNSSEETRDVRGLVVSETGNGMYVINWEYPCLASEYWTSDGHYYDDLNGKGDYCVRPLTPLEKAMK